MKKISLGLALSLLLTTAFTSESYSKCQYVAGSAVVGWTAYKTAKRVPVKGMLKKVKVKASKGKTVQKIIEGASFEVSGAKNSVDSKNAARDGKIAKFFFGNFKGGPIIKGKVTEVTSDTITTRMTFNGVSQNIPMKYTFKKGVLKARAGLDFVAMFLANKSYQELSKACAAKHEGVTGTDAQIELSAKFTGC